MAFNLRASLPPILERYGSHVRDSASREQSAQARYLIALGGAASAHPRVLAALHYVEQPFVNALTPPPESKLHRVGRVAGIVVQNGADVMLIAPLLALAYLQSRRHGTVGAMQVLDAHRGIILGAGATLGLTVHVILYVLGRAHIISAMPYT